MMDKDDPNRKRHLGEVNEAKVMRIIKSLRKSREFHATQAELVARTGLEIHVVRQILRRLRRRQKVKVSFLHSVGKKKVRVYS